MNANPIITTSWDDGHPLDFKIADLLQKYKLGGTFYIPKSNAENDVMSESMIQALSKDFEIGGHTMNHLSADQVSPQKWEEEVNACYNWLSELTGIKPVCFCFPRGIYNDVAAAAVFKAGFKLARTTELMNITKPQALKIVPTTIQIYDHSRLTYLKHLVKRRRFANLFLWIRNNSEKELDRLTDKYVKQMIATRGYLHLWGHSWEIEKYNLWDKLETVFKRISGLEETNYVPNKYLAETA
jgi:peptidoglycan-N-acetylglucosamine deacetylase